MLLILLFLSFVVALSVASPLGEGTRQRLHEGKRQRPHEGTRQRPHEGTRQRPHEGTRQRFYCRLGVVLFHPSGFSFLSFCLLLV